MCGCRWQQQHPEERLDLERRQSAAATNAAETASARQALALAAEAVEVATQAVVEASDTTSALSGTRVNPTSRAATKNEPAGTEGEGAKPQYVTAVQMAIAQREKAERAALQGRLGSRPEWFVLFVRRHIGLLSGCCLVGLLSLPYSLIFIISLFCVDCCLPQPPTRKHEQ